MKGEKHKFGLSIVLEVTPGPQHLKSVQTDGSDRGVQ